jgi:protein-S-isoprenylcysteine O-methyltransferase Ste14
MTLVPVVGLIAAIVIPKTVGRRKIANARVCELFAAVVSLRCVAFLTLAAPMLIHRSVLHPSGGNTSRQGFRTHLPFIVNIVACGMLLAILIVDSGGTQGVRPLLLAVAGNVVAAGGSAIVLLSRAKLGSAWSFLPKACQHSGLVMTGPCRLVRHPIYLGMSMMAAGQAIAFNSGPGFLVVVVGVIPSFLWRAREEEALLATFFGDRYLHYRKRTSMIIPYVL